MKTSTNRAGAAERGRSCHTNYGGYLNVPRGTVRRKEEWAGVSLDHAYDLQIPWGCRKIVQRQFIERTKAAQKAAIALKGRCPQRVEGFPILLQRDAFYTDCPNPAQAAIGQTVFLELRELADSVGKHIMSHANLDVLIRKSQCPGETLKRIADHAVEVLGIRSILEEARRHPELSSVEQYRLHQASQCSMKFPYLKDCVDAVVLFGDVLPDINFVPLHPMTRQLLGAILNYSRTYLIRLPLLPLTEFHNFFSLWARDIVESLLPFMPVERKKGEPSSNPVQADGTRTESQPENQPSDANEASTQKASVFRYDSETGKDGTTNRVPPLEDLKPPMLSETDGVSQKPKEKDNTVQKPAASRNSSGKRRKTGEKERKKNIDKFMDTVTRASEPVRGQDDRREDVVRQKIAQLSFQKGVNEGNPIEKRFLEFKLGNQTESVNLLDRTVELSDHVSVVDRLELEAAPITRALTQMFYPGEREQAQLEFAQASGSLDPRRLPIAEICEAAYRRFPVTRQSTRAGKAALLIAADGSGSLSESQMRMCKLLMTSWLKSAVYVNVEVLAALYHSVYDFPSHGTPLVQWVHHPRKNLVSNPGESVRAVASLPDFGTGVQADALSIKFMMDETVKIARGNRTYLVLITDCLWNKSFHHIPNSSQEEVKTVLEDFRKALKERLHITLVVLGKHDPGLVYAVVDEIVTVKEEELEKPEEVAVQINRYVASCIQERRHDTKR